MMLLALAGNMGGLGAMGFPASPGVASAKIDLLRSEVRAAPPKPNPACLKKCRRVTAWINPWYSRFSGRSLMAEPLMSSILTDNFRSRVAKKGAGGGVNWNRTPFDTPVIPAPCRSRLRGNDMGRE